MYKLKNMVQFIGILMFLKLPYQFRGKHFNLMDQFRIY